jgi:hypothetical protein
VLFVNDDDTAATGAVVVQATDVDNRVNSSYRFLTAMPPAPASSPYTVSVSVRARDGAGWLSSHVYSAAVKYDMHVPPAPSGVLDDLHGVLRDEALSRFQGRACVRFTAAAPAVSVRVFLGTAAGGSDVARTPQLPRNASSNSLFCFPADEVTLVSNTTYFFTVAATTECSNLTSTASSNGFLFDTLAPTVLASTVVPYNRTAPVACAAESAGGVTLMSLPHPVWVASWTAATFVGESVTCLVCCTVLTLWSDAACVCVPDGVQTTLWARALASPRCRWCSSAAAIPSACLRTAARCCLVTPVWC